MILILEDLKVKDCVMRDKSLFQRLLEGQHKDIIARHVVFRRKEVILVKLWKEGIAKDHQIFFKEKKLVFVKEERFFNKKL